MKKIRCIFCFIICITGCTHLPEAIPGWLKEGDRLQRKQKIDSVAATKNGKALLDSISLLIEKNEDQVSLQVRLAANFYSHDRYTPNKKTQDNLEKCLSISGKNGWQLLEADAAQQLANYYWHTSGDKNRSFQLYDQSFQFYHNKPVTEVDEKFRYLYEYANAYYAFEEYDKSIEFNKMALDADAENYPDKGLLISAYNTLGLCYKAKLQYDSALRYYQSGLNLATNDHNTAWQSIIEGNIGTLYFLTNRGKEARPYLEKELVRGSSNDLLSAAAASLNLAELDESDHDIAGAMKKTFDARSFSERARNRDPRLLKRIYDVMMRLQKGSGNYQLALTYADSAKLLSDCIQAKFSNAILAKAQQKMNEERYESELQASKKFNRYIQISLVAGILLLAVISLLFISRQKIKYKRKQESVEAEKRQIEKDLQAAKNELALFTKHIEEKNTLLEQFEELEHLTQKDEDKYHTLAQLERSVLLTDDQWNEFTLLFEKVHGNFLRRLKDKFPNISPAEIRIIALSKLNLSNKAMAGMLGITPDAVRMNKHRIRKKFQLEEDTDFGQFLQNI